MQLERSETMELASPEDVVRARQGVRNRAVAVGFSLVDQTKFVTAASEIARNTLIHGGGGSMHIEILSEGKRNGVRLIFRDKGPGIADLTLAMRDGYSTGGGLGMGLPGAKRLCNDFDLSSKPGEGTTVTLVRQFCRARCAIGGRALNLLIDVLAAGPRKG